MAQTVKNLPAMQETGSLGQENPLEKELLPTPVFLSGESHRQRSLAGYGSWGHKELETTERLTHKTYNLCTWLEIQRQWEGTNLRQKTSPLSAFN